ncbi:MAG TPA: sensor histidine kinase, partial [Streptosporangiaceae bacterium]|nr:sensor histidine kinase [Streptosporangiaceae bacterium]
PRGIHPAILSQNGLSAALRSLARRSSVPTALDIRGIGRLPQPVEAAAYYVVSEALTNAVSTRTLPSSTWLSMSTIRRCAFR